MNNVLVNQCALSMGWVCIARKFPQIDMIYSMKYQSSKGNFLAMHTHPIPQFPVMQTVASSIYHKTKTFPYEGSKFEPFVAIKVV